MHSWKKQGVTNIYSFSSKFQWSFQTFVYMQYMGEVGANFEVYRNDEITVEEIKKLVAVPAYVKSYVSACWFLLIKKIICSVLSVSQDFS